MGDWRLQVTQATAVVRAPSGEPLGTAVLVSPSLALTCYHVVSRDGEAFGEVLEAVELVFPGGQSIRVYPIASPLEIDAIVLKVDSNDAQGLPSPLILSSSRRIPTEVALLGYPFIDNTRDSVWRTFGVLGPTSRGLVQLHALDSPSERGHSGGPVVDAGSGELVGLLTEGSRRLDFDRYLPLTALEDAGMLELPWAFGGEDAASHFKRRSHGQRGETGVVDVFTGRLAALEKAKTWVTADIAPGQVLVVTGQPGAGKSAVVGRVGLALSREEPLAQGRGLVFHARNATVKTFLLAISNITGAQGPETVPGLLEWLERSPSAPPMVRWVILVDALDECASKNDRVAICGLLSELARRPDFRVIAATRALSSGGPFSRTSLLRRLGVNSQSDVNLIDLDDDEFFDQADLSSFVADLLTQRGEDYAAPPHGAWKRYRSDRQLTRSLANAVAANARRNFLVAALTAVALSEQARVVDPKSSDFRLSSLPTSLEDALDQYLQSRPHPAETRGVLTSLAYARGAGVNDAIWRRMADALGYPVSQGELDGLRESAACDYLLERVSERDGIVVRLFHQALVDQLLVGRDTNRDERQIALFLTHYVAESGGWTYAPEYAIDHLAEHAHSGGELAAVLKDLQYLLCVNLDILNTCISAWSPGQRSAEAWVVRCVGGRAGGLNKTERSGLLAVVALHLGMRSLAVSILEQEDFAFLPLWAHTLGVMHASLEGHDGEVLALATVRSADGNDLLASGSADYSVRLWEPASGTAVGKPLLGHTGRVQALCALSIDGKSLLASGGVDRSINIWNVSDGTMVHRFLGHRDWIQALIYVSQGDDDGIMASASDDGSIRLWDVAGQQAIGVPILAHSGAVWALASGKAFDGDPCLISGGQDGSVRLWDLSSGSLIRELMSDIPGGVVSLCVLSDGEAKFSICAGGGRGSVHIWSKPDDEWIVENLCAGAVWSLTGVLSGGKELLACGGTDGGLSLLDPGVGVVGGPVNTHGGSVNAVVSVPARDEEVLLATAGADGAVHLMEPELLLMGSHAAMPGHADWVWAVAHVNLLGGSRLIASASTDGTVRLWDAETGLSVGDPMFGHQGPVWSVASIELGDRTLIASVGHDPSVRLWDAVSGRAVTELTGHSGTGGISAVSAVQLGNEVLVASAGTDATVRLWDPISGSALGEPMKGHVGNVRALTQVQRPNDAVLLATAGQDGTIRLWDARTQQQRGVTLRGHSAAVSAVATIPRWDGSNGDLLVSASLDATIRIWDPETCQEIGPPLVGHKGRIRAVAALRGNRDGRWLLASAGTDSNLRLWDPKVGRQVGNPLRMPESGTAIATSATVIAVATGRAVCALRLIDTHG